MCNGWRATQFTCFFQISTLENWLVTDMNASRAVVPTLKTDDGWLTVTAYEVSSPFWLAPQIYTGNRLSSYGSNLTYSVTWVVIRGDSSGKPTIGPNVILVVSISPRLLAYQSYLVKKGENARRILIHNNVLFVALFAQGNNGLRIAYGEEQYSGDKAKISVPLREHNWYHVRDEIRDIPTRSRRTEFRGDPVTKIQMMRVLADLKHLMIRAQYHSEQIEGRYVRIIEPFNSNLRSLDELSILDYKIHQLHSLKMSIFLYIFFNLCFLQMLSIIWFNNTDR